MDPVLFENFVRQVRQLADISKKNRPIAKQWFDIAKNDLQVSKVLYKEKYWPHSVYFLQQSFEKLTKSYFILSGRADPEDVGTHKFNLTKMKNEIRDQFINTMLELMKSISEKAGTDIRHIELKTELLDIIEKNEDDLRMIDEKSISSLIELIKKIEDALTNSRFTTKVYKKLQRRKVKSSLRHLVYMITRFRVPYSKIEQYASKTNIERFVEDSMISIRLLFLGLVTFLHYNTPRYPYDKNSKVNYFDYTESMGVVKCSPALHRYCSQIIKTLEKKYLNE